MKHLSAEIDDLFACADAVDKIKEDFKRFLTTEEQQTLTKAADALGYKAAKLIKENYDFLDENVVPLSSILAEWNELFIGIIPNNLEDAQKLADELQKRKYVAYNGKDTIFDEAKIAWEYNQDGRGKICFLSEGGNSVRIGDTFEDDAAHTISIDNVDLNA